ncbi:MAG: hypothetical protein U0586_12825 [Candidatus Brocadiaceae bacterium]
MIKYKYTFIFLICFIAGFLFPSQAWCEIPQLKIVTATSENIIDVDNKKSQFDGLSHSNGGAVLNTTIGTQAVIMLTSFGQPFAGRAYSTSANGDLLADAESHKDKGAPFIDDDKIYDKIFRKVLIEKDENGNLDYEHLGKDENGNPIYDEDELIQAEEYYRCLLNVDPYSQEAVEGILQARLARVRKGNLVWDIRRREQLRLRLTKIEKTSTQILNDEIGILNQISDIQRKSIALLMELYSDTTNPNGPGTLLRGEGTISNPDLVNESMKVIYSTTRRFAEAEYQLGFKRVLLNYFNQGDAGNEQGRAFAVNGLLNASAYITELLRLLNPYFKDDLNGTSDVGQVIGLRNKLDELMRLMNQGYNPFGFLNDFVPFVSGSYENNNLSTFNKMHGIAKDAVDIAKTKEDNARSLEKDFLDFAKDNDEYETRLLETNLSYQQRLKSLIGTMKLPNEVEEEADVLTFLFPDKDLDGDGMTERDKARADLIAKEGLTFGSKGEISAQYDTIATAEIRVEESFNEVKNVVSHIKIINDTAQTIAGIIDNENEQVISIIEENGKKVGLLIRQKGRLQEAAIQKLNERQRRDAPLRALLGGASSVLSMFGGGEMPQYKSGNTELSPEPKCPWCLVALVAVGIGKVIQDVNSASDSASIQGQLALDTADIDAQINEVNYMERADIQSIQLEAEKQKLMADKLQEIRTVALEQANKSLNVHIAQRDLRREWTVLINKINEVGMLVADSNRMDNLLKKNQNNLTLGWIEGDARDVLTDNVLKADQAFFRAQVWCFVALRALEYYANKPPQGNGQPHIMIMSMYNNLYSARKYDDLYELLSEMQSKADSDFVFTISTTSCGERGLLSFKYDVLVPALVNYSNNGQPVEGGVSGEDYYRYLDPLSGKLYEGKKAFQAVFRNFLHQGITGTIPNRALKLVFATDLYPRYFDSYGMGGNNPFFFLEGNTAKIIGFSDSNCDGPGVEDNVQGIQVNLTGTLNSSDVKRLSLAQRGNSYLNHMPWSVDDSDFDDNGMLINPLNKVTVYSSYKQIIPTWLIGDIASGTSTAENVIGSDVIGSFRPLVNGADGGKTLVFTDRSVANDRWELVILEPQNRSFFIKLDNMLASPIPEDPSEDFLTDIQLWIGWAYRNPNANQKPGKQAKIQ